MATIADILRWPSNAPIPELICTVTRTYEGREGVGQHGPWRVMNIELKDASGTTKAAGWNPDLAGRDIQNRRVRIAAEADQNGIPRGAVVVRDTYKGQERVQLKVQGANLQLWEPAPAAAPAAHVPAPTPVRHPLPLPGIAPLTQLIALIEHMTVTLQTLGYEGQALSAVVNTILIAVTQGRCSIDLPLRPVAEPPVLEATASEDVFSDWPVEE